LGTVVVDRAHVLSRRARLRTTVLRGAALRAVVADAA
jgi:hypothetical protein